MYHTSVVLLRVRWQALHFMAGVAPLKPMWVLKPLRFFARSLLLSYLDMLGSVKWFKVGASLISYKMAYCCIVIKVTGPLRFVKITSFSSRDFLMWLRLPYSLSCSLDSIASPTSRWRVDIAINRLVLHSKLRFPVLPISG